MHVLALEDARALLEVSEHADAVTIGRAHRRLRLSAHPDGGGSNAVPGHQRCRDLAEMLPAPRSQRALAMMREASSARATSDLAEIHGRGELARRESWQAGGNGQGWEVRADLLRGQEDQVTYLAEGRASENCRM